MLRTCSLFASLEERSNVVSSLPSYWQLRRASLHLERLWNSSAKVELVFDKNELFMRDLTDINTLRLTWNFKASDAITNEWSNLLLKTCSLRIHSHLSIPWSSIAGRFELKSWSVFSDGRFVPVEVNKAHHDCY